MRRIGNLEFNENEFAIRKYKKNESDRGEWYREVTQITFTKAEVMKMKVDENKSLDLNAEAFEKLGNWIESMRRKGISNKSIDLIEKEINSYEKPRETHVYVLCERTVVTRQGEEIEIKDIPVYVGIQHDRNEKAGYWGSSKTYKAIKGTIKYIVADNLNHKEASEIEEYLIRKLKGKYKDTLQNNTPGSLNIREEMRARIIEKQQCEIYIRH